MSTGIETWNVNLLDIGPMYPFPGTEMLWVVIGIGSWILWHIIQWRMEAKVMAEERREFSDKAKLEQAMKLSNAETLMEALKVHDNNS
jgi:hypothetical protein